MDVQRITYTYSTINKNFGRFNVGGSLGASRAHENEYEKGKLHKGKGKAYAVGHLGRCIIDGNLRR